MTKRFTDTEKWDDPWYRKLGSLNRDFWNFLTDKCDVAGFWKKDIDIAQFFIGQIIDTKKSFENFNNGKIRIIDHGEYWELVGFIPFQYGVPSRDCKAHNKIFNLLEKYRNKGFSMGIHTLEEQVKEMEEEKEIKGIVKGIEKTKYLDFVFLKDDEYQKLVEKLGKDLADRYIDRLNNGIGSKGYKYKSHYHTILNWWHKDCGNATPAQGIVGAVTDTQKRNIIRFKQFEKEMAVVK